MIPPIITLSLDNVEIDNRDSGTTELHTKDGYRIELSTELVQAILNSVKENLPPETKAYIIAHDGYLDKPDMQKFEGTYRQLLEMLCNVEPEMYDDPIDESDPKYKGRTVKDLTDEEMLSLFNEANGDGQPFYMVWCVEDGKRVI